MGDHQGPGPEPVERGWPAARVRRPGRRRGGLDDAAPGQHPLQVGGRDRVAERGGVDVPQLGDREGLRGQREADVGVGQLGAQPVAPGFGDRPVVERDGREAADGVPGGVGGDARFEAGRDQGQVGGGQYPAAGVASGVAAGLQLLEVGDVGEVDLGGQVAARRGAEALPGAQRSARQRPQSVERRRGPPPEQHAQPVAADLQDHGQRLVREPLAWLVRGLVSPPPVYWHARIVLSPLPGSLRPGSIICTCSLQF